MALRGTKVGDVVAVEPMAHKTLYGTILSIDAQGLRCIATADGYHYATPDAMHAVPPEVVDCTRPVTALEPGDRVVLFSGIERTVEHVVPTGQPVRYRVTFVEQDKVLGVFREQTVQADQRYYVA